MVTNDKKEQLQDKKRKMDIMNNCRLFLLVIGLLLLLFLYFGNKFYGASAWYAVAGNIVFRIVEWDIILMVITTFVRLYFTAKYNQLVKKG